MNHFLLHRFNITDKIDGLAFRTTSDQVNISEYSFCCRYKKVKRVQKRAVCLHLVPKLVKSFNLPSNEKKIIRNNS